MQLDAEKERLDFLPVLTPFLPTCTQERVVQLDAEKERLDYDWRILHVNRAHPACTHSFLPACTQERLDYDWRMAQHMVQQLMTHETGERTLSSSPPPTSVSQPTHEALHEPLYDQPPHQTQFFRNR